MSNTLDFLNRYLVGKLIFSILNQKISVMHVTIVPKFLIVIRLMTTKILWATFVTTMMIRIVTVFLTLVTTVSVIPMPISWILTVTEWETNVILMPIMINFSMNKTIVCWFSIRINRQVLLDYIMVKMPPLFLG